MSCQVAELDTSLRFSESRLVGRVLLKRHGLNMRVKAFPENFVWEVHFASQIAFRVADERDILKFWPACSRGIVFEIHSDGWLAEANASLDCVAAGFYGPVREFLVAGDDIRVNVLSFEAPTLGFGSSSTSTRAADRSD